MGGSYLTLGRGMGAFPRGGFAFSSPFLLSIWLSIPLYIPTPIFLFSFYLSGVGPAEKV